jgi:hypothetical protein
MAAKAVSATRRITELLKFSVLRRHHAFILNQSRPTMSSA